MRWDQSLEAKISNNKHRTVERVLLMSTFIGGIGLSAIGLIAGWYLANQVLYGPLGVFGLFIAAIFLWRFGKLVLSLGIVAAVLMLWLLSVLAPTPWSAVLEIGGGIGASRSIELDISSLILIVPFATAMILWSRAKVLPDQSIVAVESLNED